MQHKTRYVSTGPDYPVRFHWDPTAGTVGSPEGCYVQDNDTFAPLATKRMVASVLDMPMWSEACMQDLSEVRVSWDHLSVTNDVTFMSQNPSINMRYYNIGFPGEVVRLSDAYVIEKLEDEEGKPWTPSDVLKIGVGSPNLYSRLSQLPIRSMMKELDHPLDSEFSVWYIIRDMRDLGKLARGFIKSSLRIKSIMNSSGMLRDLFGKRSMKEFASSHLAIQYGLLPTIADIRETVHLMFEWYNTWVTKSHKLGAVRTYNGKLKTLVPELPEFTQRLRFLTYGGEYHYVDALVTPGPVISSQTVKYYFICPEFTSVMTVFSHLIDLSGVLDPAAFWDSLPFSFVVDWFINISRFLWKRKPRLFPISMVVCDWGEGLSQEHHVRLMLDYLGSSWETIYEHRCNELLCSATIRQRARKRQFPIPMQINPGNVVGNGLTIKRIINGVAIVVGLTVKPGNGRATNYRNRPSAKNAKATAKWEVIRGRK